MDWGGSNNFRWMGGGFERKYRRNETIEEKSRKGDMEETHTEHAKEPYISNLRIILVYRNLRLKS